MRVDERGALARLSVGGEVARMERATVWRRGWGVELRATAGAMVRDAGVMVRGVGTVLKCRLDGSSGRRKNAVPRGFFHFLGL